MCTNKFILFCMGIVMSVSSSAWAGDDIPLYKGTFIKYYKISQLIHTQSIAN